MSKGIFTFKNDFFSHLSSKRWEMSQTTSVSQINLAELDFNFKISLIGDGGVGKSSFISSIKGQKFNRRYNSTSGVSLSQIVFLYRSLHQEGKITFNVWDCAGQEKYSLLKDQYYIGSHGAIVMCDVSSKISLKNMDKWIKDFTRMNTSPIVLCANKNDIIETRKVKPEFANIGEFVSSKTGENCITPFLILAKKILQDDSIELQLLTDY